VSIVAAFELVEMAPRKGQYICDDDYDDDYDDNYDEDDEFYDDEEGAEGEDAAKEAAQASQVGVLRRLMPAFVGGSSPCTQ
jgi:hypothetical protein